MPQSISKRELRERIEAMHGQLAATIAELTPEQLSQPSLPDGWAVKDVLTHITWWEQRLIQVLQSVQRGEPFERLGQPGEDGGAVVDRVNADVFRQHRAASAADALMERQRSFASVLAAIDALAEGDAIDMAALDAAAGFDVAGFIAGDTYEHYAEHDTAIKEWLSRAATSNNRSV